MRRILVVDDEQSLRATFEAFLIKAGHEVEVAASFADAIAILERRPCDMIISDILLGAQTGIDLLGELKERGLDLPVVMVTGYPSMDTAVEAIRLGAFDYLAKPVTRDDLLHVTDKALRYKQMQEEKENYKAHLEGIFRSVRDGLVTVDSNGRVTAYNTAVEDLLQLKGEPIVGRLYAEVNGLSGPVMRSLIQKTLEERKSTSTERHQITLDERTTRVVSLATSPLLLPGEIFAGAVLVLHDETRVTELERNLHDRRHFHRLVGKSSAMQTIYELIEDLAEVPSTVLVIGESGTGKELVADALHYLGSRQHGPLVKVNCAALSDTLLESELFGHVRGAFTGAIQNRVGRFQKADGGTIFLDEIGDISPGMQQRLLRVLQEKQFEKVGDQTPIDIDVRVIAATNQDLAAKVRKGEFREDLYYRLNVVMINLPPLRDRREDIPMLAEHFRIRLNQELNRQVEVIEESVMDSLMSYKWPGNVRELQHLLEHAFIRCRENRLSLEHLPPTFFESSRPQNPVVKGDNEPDSLRQALRRAGGNKSKAARLLGIDRKTLYRKLEKYDLSPEELDPP